MKAKNPDWYKHCWDLSIKQGSWVENTEEEVDFIIQTLELTGQEKILDLACGFGRHALSFAKRGFEVVGVDLTEAYIEDAKKEAEKQGLYVQFICQDIREVNFTEAFDVVLNLADGAIGYLENDEENLKIFDVVARALKPGGKHFMDICNADHARHFFPKRNWEMGEKAIALSEFEWDEGTKRMLFGGIDLVYGEPLPKPGVVFGDPTRLYDLEEISTIYQARGMVVKETFSNYKGAPSSSKALQLMVYGEK